MTRKRCTKLLMAAGYPKNFINATFDMLTNIVKTHNTPPGYKLEYEFQHKYMDFYYDGIRENVKYLEGYYGKYQWKNTQREIYLDIQSFIHMSCCGKPWITRGNR